MAPNSHIDPAENDVHKTDMTDHFKLAFRKERIVCAVAKERTLSDIILMMTIFGIQSVRNQVSLNFPESDYLHLVASDRIYEGEDAQITKERPKSSLLERVSEGKNFKELFLGVDTP